MIYEHLNAFTVCVFVKKKYRNNEWKKYHWEKHRLQIVSMTFIFSNLALSRQRTTDFCEVNIQWTKSKLNFIFVENDKEEKANKNAKIESSQKCSHKTNKIYWIDAYEIPQITVNSRNLRNDGEPMTKKGKKLLLTIRGSNGTNEAAMIENQRHPNHWQIFHVHFFIFCTLFSGKNAFRFYLVCDDLTVLIACVRECEYVLIKYIHFLTDVSSVDSYANRSAFSFLEKYTAKLNTK